MNQKHWIATLLVLALILTVAAGAADSTPESRELSAGDSDV